MKVSYSKYQLGISLIESMIATLIISLGILGVAGMQMIAMKGNSHAVQQGQASDVMNGLLERMRSNVAAVYADDYTITDSSTYQCGTALSKNCEDGVTKCNGTELAKSDLYHTICGYDAAHLSGIRSVLADGAISVSCLGGVGSCDKGINFKVSWSERILGKEGNGKQILPREISLDTVIVE
jgi:type IV pilus assembly protein PilV